MMRNTQRLLIVDDQDLSIAPIVAYLQRNGYEVASAASGEAALSALAEVDFQVMVTDLDMPGMDGMQLVQHAAQLHPHLDLGR